MNSFLHASGLYLIWVIEIGAAWVVYNLCSIFILFLDLVAFCQGIIVLRFLFALKFFLERERESKKNI